jgi:hypothetical protein
MGTLYYGDNLGILRRYLEDESVDLVYLAPPFNSAQIYNAFFSEKDGSAAARQIHAFEDTWHWDIETNKAYDAVTKQPGKVSKVKIGRDRIGIDPAIAGQLAISLIKNRLQDTYGRRLKFIPSSSRREESPSEVRSPKSKARTDQSLVTSAAAGEKVSLVRIIGEPSWKLGASIPGKTMRTPKPMTSSRSKTIVLIHE